MTASPTPATPAPGPLCAVFAPLLPLLSSAPLEEDDDPPTREHVAGCAWCQQELARYMAVDEALRQSYGEAAQESALAFPFDLDGGDEVEDYAFILEDTLEESMAEGDDPRDQQPSTPARSSGWGGRQRALSPRATAIAGIAAVLILAVVATTIYTQFAARLLTPAPTRTPTPGQFSTGAFEAVPLPVVPGGIPWLTPSPRDPATAYVCPNMTQQAPSSGENALWVTHDAGQTWSRVALPAGSGTGCDVEPAFDGSHRVALSTSADAPDQSAPACAHNRFFLSDDDGATWRSIALTSLAPPISPDGDCFLVVTARHLFVDIEVNRNGGGAQSILLRSDDDGRTWQRADHGLVALHLSQTSQFQKAPWFALPLDGTGEALVTLVTNSSGGNGAHADLWVTHDAGAHWQRVTAEKLPDPSFDVGGIRTEPALADASRACQCVVVVNAVNVLNQRASSPLNLRLYSSRDLVHWTPVPPLPVQGTSAQFSGVYATPGMTGDGRLLALGPDPEGGVPSFNKAPPALWMWDTHTGRWAVARTRLPCVTPQNCYGDPDRTYYGPTFGVSVSAGAPGQPPGTWFWIALGGAGHDFRVFIPAA